MKTMNNNIYNTCKTIILLAFMVILFSGCEKELKIKPDDFPPMLVLNGVVEQDSIICINVSRTAGLNEVYSIEDLFVIDAKVKLYDGDNFIEEMQHDSIGFYSASISAQGGHKYSIKVEKDKYPEATAYLDFSNVPAFEISNFSFERTDSLYTYDIPEPGGEVLLKMFRVYYDLSLTDNGEENNYYSFNAMTKYQYIIHIHNDEGLEGVELTDLKYQDVGAYIKDWTEWEKYNEQYFGQGIWNNPGYAFKAIDDNMFNGQCEKIEFYSFFDTFEISDLSIVVKSYPVSLVKYLESVELYQNVDDNPYSEPVNIYSNVENGAGFVCGVPSSKIVFDLE